MELMTKQGATLSVPKGYKQTEVGLIPEDWKVKELGQIANIIGGGTPKTSVNQYWNGNINWFTPTEVGKHKYLVASKRKITYEGLQNSSAQILPIGTILLTSRAGIGDLGILTEESATNQGFQSLIVFDENDNEYVYYLLSILKPKLLRNASGSTFLEISPSKVKEIFTALPPTLTEQKVIATALSDVDALITSLEQTITKKKAIKQGAMQQLLTPPHKGGKRLPGFEGEWMEKTLGELSSMNSGGTPSSKVSEYYDGNIKWVSISDITKAGKYIDDSAKKITEKGLQNSSARLFPINTLLLAMYASIGKCCIARTEVTTSQAILGIKTTKSLLLEFLYYYLTYKQDEIANQGQQGTQSNLNKGMVQDILINIPIIKEQKAIAQILSDVDAEITQLESKKEKYQAIKQGMMQELLTGKTRLI